MQSRALLGGFLGSVSGLVLGALLGLAIGVSMLGNNPTVPPSTDGQAEVVRMMQEGGNKAFKFFGGVVGCLAGGAIGAVSGGGIGAALAVRRKKEVADPNNAKQAG